MIDIESLETKTSTEYDGCKRVLYKLICPQCNKDYWRPKKALEESKCCSRECYTEFRAKTGKRFTYNCTLCDKQFKRFKHHADAVISGRLFCSRDCKAKYFTKEHENCKQCQIELILKQFNFCSHDCQIIYYYNDNINKWKSGELSGMNISEGMNVWLRRYMLEKANYKCSQCNWCEVNPTTGKIPLQVDHIDGNYKNNKEDNLRVLCPNCHSLTATFGSLNKGKGREKRRKKLQENAATHTIAL